MADGDIGGMMSGHIWYLVEDYNAFIDYKDGIVVSLTPEACYQFGKAGIKYNVVEDFYCEKDLKLDEDNYFTEQLKWFKDFDKLLKDRIEQCRKYDLELARSHYYQLKYFVDSVIIQARVLGDVISNINPDEIVYVCDEKEPANVSNIYDLCNNKRKFFLELSLLICRKYAIPIHVEYSTVKNARANSASTIRKSIKKVLKKIHLKSVYYLFKYNKFSKFLNNQKDRLSILILHSGWLGIDMLVRKSIALGHKVYFKDNNRITLISDVIQKDVLDLTNFDILHRENVRHDCVDVFNNMVRGKDILNWINNKCGIEVSELIAPYFKHFIENICVNNIMEIILLKDFYADKKIDFVLTRSSSEDDSISALSAARSFKGRVCFQHGIMHDTKVVAITELDLVDHYFAMEGISKECFESCLHLDYVSECSIFQSSHYLRAIAERRKKNMLSGAIVYAPTRIFAGLNVFNVNYYTLTRYYELQKAVIDLLGSTEDKSFIYKCTGDQDWLSNSILQYLKDKNYKNINVKKVPLSECLKKAERLILDYPATGFYEAAASNIPVMSLFHDTFKMDDRIRKHFGRAIQDFSSIPEAIQHIENFINAPSGDFTVNIPLNDDSAMDILKEIKNKKGQNAAS